MKHLVEAMAKRSRDGMWDIEDGFVKGTVDVSEDDTVTLTLVVTFQPNGFEGKSGQDIDKARAAATALLDPVAAFKKAVAKLKFAILSDRSP